MSERLPLPEVRFLTIVIGIQQQAGGNLSEALGNLSGVLRDRQMLAMKVKALSAEAKASAMVLGVIAARRDDHGLHLDARLHHAAFHDDARPVHGCGGCGVDADRRAHHAEDDQLQVLTVSLLDQTSNGGAPMTSFIETMMNPQFIATILAAVCVFATVLTVALPMLQRDQMNRRMKEMAIERGKMRSARLADMASKDRQTGRLRATPKGFMQRIVDELKLREYFDNEELRENLKRAGLRGQANIVYFMFFRVAAPIAVFLFALFYVFFLYDTGYPPLINFLIALGAGFLGFYLPNMFITNRVQKRQMAIKQAFPDALDMLLICVQSGMSVESGFAKVGKEIASQSIELAEEMTLTTAELSYLQDRRQAYENLAKRTGLPGVKAVTTALIQAERYGTPVGQALRSMAKENREIRQSEAERKAAALPPKLTVPMIVFFLPVLFIVILGPAGISYMQLPP